LYKYLNPNIISLTTINAATSTASIHVLDSVSGNVLYETKHTNVDTTRPIPAVLSENWLSYSLTLNDAPHAKSRGYQLFHAKFYESELPNDRGILGANTNYSTLSPDSSEGALRPFVRSTVFQIPEEISLLSVSQTTQGITSRILMAYLPGTAGIIGIPLSVLDPRRPVGRDPSKIEQEEGLSRYGPNLEFDPKWMLSHRREVQGIERILTSPAVLESTSLVFAYGYGGDVFGTRVAPSFTFDVLSSEFNKIQMMLTVAALGAAVLFVAPLVSLLISYYTVWTRYANSTCRFVGNRTTCGGLYKATADIAAGCHCNVGHVRIGTVDLYNNTTVALRA
jgi:hypothetical protein